MAQGDILSTTIGADGWYADIVIEGRTVGGTMDFGLGANNDPTTGTPKVVFTVVSLGYDDTGTATTITRTIYGTTAVRKPYPDEATLQQTTSGSDVILRIALSDYIYAKDIAGAGFVENVSSGTAPTVTILSGLYSQGSNAVTNLAVTNSSTLAYPKVVANWSWPGYDRITSSTFPLRAVAFHSSAQSGRPVRVVKFTAADEHAHSATPVLVTTPTIDGTMGDAVPVVEYVATMDASGLDALDVVTCNFVAYPWVGDTAACLDTSGGTAQPTPLFGPIPLFNDKNATYGRTFAFVDGVGGSGAVVNRADYASDAAAEAAAKLTPFATLAAAVTAIASYNNTTHGRNDCGAGEVIMGTGNFTWPGAAVTYGNKPETWLIVRGETGAANTAAVFNNGSATTKIGELVKCSNVKFGTSGIELSNVDSYWFDQCDLEASNASYAFFLQTLDVFYVTRSTVRDIRYGIRPYSSTGVACPGIVRGNQLAGFVRSILAYTVLGNKKVAPHNSVVATYITNFLTATQTIPLPDNCIIAYNSIESFFNGNQMAISVPNQKQYTGIAIVQNLIEQCTAYASATNILDCGLTGTATPCDNYLVWHNTSLGQGSCFAYNGVGSTNLVRNRFSLKNNIFDSFGVECDTTNTGDAGRAPGNWSVVLQVGSSGNGFTHLAGMANKFPEYSGIKSDLAGSPNPDDYWKFTDDKASKGSVATAGGGTYTLQPDSPAKGLQLDWVLSYDLAGNPRGALDDAGVYASRINRIARRYLILGRRLLSRIYFLR